MSKIDKSVYRPSASLIIAAKTDTIEEGHDYQLLLIKRTQNTAYAPDHCVFPGGVFETESDESQEWLNYFHEFGVTEKELQQLQVSSSKRPKPLLTAGVNFSRDISLRICALRETFEEVGVLLCRDRYQLAQGHASNGYLYEGTKGFDRAHWQHLVHNDAQQFLNLCRHLEVVPDLWSLYEWSVWRSPVTASRKFDTVLYIVGLERKPQLLLESSEIDLALWYCPPAFLRIFKQRTIWLPPLHVYELSRMTHMQSFQSLLEFARLRNNKGSTTLLPFYYKCNDGLVGTFSGDELYPKDFPRREIELQVPYAIADFQEMAKHRHRIIFRDLYDQVVELTIPPIDDHLSPVKKIAFDSKL